MLALNPSHALLKSLNEVTSTERYNFQYFAYPWSEQVPCDLSLYLGQPSPLLISSLKWTELVCAAIQVMLLKMLGTLFLFGMTDTRVRHSNWSGDYLVAHKRCPSQAVGQPSDYETGIHALYVMQAGCCSHRRSEFGPAALLFNGEGV